MDTALSSAAVTGRPGARTGSTRPHARDGREGQQGCPGRGPLLLPLRLPPAPRGFSCEPRPRPRRQGGQITRKEWALEPTVGPRGCPVPPGRGCPPRRATGRSPAPRASAGSSAEATPSRDETKDGVGRSPGRRAWRRGQGGHALPVTPCRPARSPRGSLSGWERGCPSQANARMPLGCHGNCRSAQASRIDSG